MRSLLFLLALIGAGFLAAQVTILDVDFERDTPLQLPRTSLGESDNPSGLFGRLSDISIRQFGGDRGMSEAAGLVTMIDVHHLFQGSVREIEFDAVNFTEPINSGEVEVSYDFIVEHSDFGVGGAYLRNYGTNFESFADLVIIKEGGIFHIGPLSYATDPEGEIDMNNMIQLPILQWYRLTVRLDFNQGATTVLINGQEIGPATSFGEVPGEGFIGSLLHWGEDYSGAMCIDNFRISVDNTAQTALPVSWSGVHAEWADDCASVAIKWQTEREESVAGFQLQRLAGGQRWENVGERIQPGSSIYSLNDRQAKGSQPFYRIRQTDLDGTAYYSNVFQPAANDCDQGKVLDIFPNPASIELQLTSKVDTRSDFRIINVSGKEVLRGKLTGELTKISIAAFPSGIYWLQSLDQSLRFVVD